MKKFFIPALLFLFTILNLSCSNVQIMTHHPDKYQVIDKLRKSTIALIETDDDGSKYPFCTGVWINEETILTAFHCAQGYATNRYMEKATDQEQLYLSLGLINIDPIDIAIPYAIEQDYNILGQNPKHIYNAVVIATEPDHDLAMLSVHDLFSPEHQWLHVHEYMPNVSDNVYIDGNQGGLNYTIMPGMVAAIRPTFPDNSLHFQGPFLQIYSSIWNGNSGGPVISEDGELLGIVSFILPVPNQGFVVACPEIRRFIINTYIAQHNSL